ncbi:MAG: DUF2281 domain-containing protein [Desulfamplus sp.]|nr:DUF2281 domain-containing protein [Desulfamplus sp.]
MNTQLLERKLNALPEELRREVFDFIDFIMTKATNIDTKKSGNFNFTWEGGLLEYQDKYSSVELQHKSMEWR